MNNKQEEDITTKYEIWQPFLLAIMVAIGILLGYKMNDKAERFVTSVDSGTEVRLGRVEEIIRFIEARYVDTIKSDELVEEAIYALVQKLDPHSMYISADQLNEVAENMDGNFKGIGIESLFVDDTVALLKILKGSPSDKAGLKQFDQIISINDTVVAGKKMPFEQIRKRFKSNQNHVKLEIRRNGVSTTLIKMVSIESIPIHSADVSYMVNDSVGYIQIKQFSSNTYQEFMEHFEDLYEKHGMKHLILDLRGNPGGYLPQATKIINQLIREKDKLIVYTEGRNHNRQDYLTNGKAFFNLDKIAVLVDQNSASGSEVIAGAIQDHDRGIIVGRRTYGKGLVQEQFNLSNGSALRLTTARYYTPSGRSIQKEITSQESYDAEVDSRSIFEPDTKEISSKSKEFKTLILGRKVFGGRGIEPEIFIPGDSMTITNDYYHLESYCSEFLCRKLLRNQLSRNSVIDFESLSDQYIKYVKKYHANLNTTQKIKERSRTLLKENFEYIINNGNDTMLAQSKGSDDSFIKAALDYTSNKIKLK